MKKVIIPIVIIVVLILLGGGIYYAYQNTELFGKKVVPIKISDVSILYVPGYDIDDAKKLNSGEKEIVKIQEIKINSKELKTIKNDLRKITKKEKKNKDFKGKYEILVNGKTTIRINEKNGYIDKDSVAIPNSLLNDIDALIDKNNDKVIKTNTFESIVIKMSGSSITVKNKDNLKYLHDSLLYYPMTLSADYKTFDNGYKIEAILDNQTHIYLYESTNVGYIQEKDNATFAIFTGDFKNIIKQIHDKSVE